MAAEFERETRYAVIKFSDLSEAQTDALQNLMATYDIPTREAAVVEADWPEYEWVWEMIKRRVTTGQTVEAIRFDYGNDGYNGGVLG